MIELFRETLQTKAPPFEAVRRFDEKIEGKPKSKLLQDRPIFDLPKSSKKSDKNRVRSNINKEVA